MANAWHDWPLLGVGHPGVAKIIAGVTDVNKGFGT